MSGWSGKNYIIKTIWIFPNILITRIQTHLKINSKFGSNILKLICWIIWDCTLVLRPRATRHCVFTPSKKKHFVIASEHFLSHFYRGWWRNAAEGLIHVHFCHGLNKHLSHSFTRHKIQHLLCIIAHNRISTFWSKQHIGCLSHEPNLVALAPKSPVARW